jgi:signal transduction histidine kinase
MVDAIEIEQVVLNLVRNGIEALQEVPARQRRMDIRTMRRNDAIEIDVGDNGPGLPTESNRLFDAFFSTKPNGLGMGLAIGRTIVEAHGGRISAESNGECGALFRLYLPIDADQVTHG